MKVSPLLLNSGTAGVLDFRQAAGLPFTRAAMSLPRKSTRSGTRGYAHLVEVKVPVARVWRALTDPALVRIWTGQEAEIDAREGGMYRIGKRQAGGREAHIDIFEVNRRLRLIYMQTPELPSNESAVGE